MFQRKKMIIVPIGSFLKLMLIYFLRSYIVKILVIEDSSVLQKNLQFLLKKFHFVVELASDWHEWLKKVALQKYDAIVLDNHMPHMTGKEFLMKLRSQNNTTLVVMLTSDSQLQDKITMFDIWADDYLTKPFEIEELVVRLKALWKRNTHLLDEKIHFRSYTINFTKWSIYDENNDEIQLPHKQYLILELLTKNKWYAQSKNKIMQYVWGEQEENLELSSTTLESHVYAIRQKLWKDVIQTRKGSGYIIQ